MAGWIIVTAIMFSYLGIVFIIGMLAGRGRKFSVLEYEVAERGLGVIALFFMMGSTIFSAFTFLGGPGWAFSKGGACYYIVIYCSLGVLPWYLIGPKLSRIGNKLEHFTQGDLLEDRYRSRLLAALVGGIAVVAFIQYIALQLRGMGFVTSILTGGHIPMWVGALFAYGIVITYVWFSGVRGAAWSDILQGLMMTSIAVVLGLVLTFTLHGGPTSMFAHIQSAKPGFLLIGKAGSVMGRVPFTTAIVLSVIGFMMWPHLFSKSYASSVDRIKKTTLMYPIFALFTFFVMMIGFSAIFEISPGELGAPSHVLPALVKKLGWSPWVIGILGAGTLAAAMGSADVITHGAGSALFRDVVRRFKPEIKGAREVWGSRFGVLTIGGIAYYLALFAPKGIVGLLLGGYGYISQFAPLVYGALFWRRATKYGAIAGLLGGVITYMSFDYTPLISPYGINPGLLGVMVNIILFVVVSLASEPQPMDHVKQFIYG